jgi:hypothetical protein
VCNRAIAGINVFNLSETGDMLCLNAMTKCFKAVIQNYNNNCAQYSANAVKVSAPVSQIQMLIMAQRGYQKTISRKTQAETANRN